MTCEEKPVEQLTKCQIEKRRERARFDNLVRGIEAPRLTQAEIAARLARAVEALEMLGQRWCPLPDPLDRCVDDLTLLGFVSPHCTESLASNGYDDIRSICYATPAELKRCYQVGPTTLLQIRASIARLDEIDMREAEALVALWITAADVRSERPVGWVQPLTQEATAFHRRIRGKN
jgi:hypothetical protein